MDANELLPLSRAARELPGFHGRGVHPSTLWRWARDGLRFGDRLVKLATVVVGGRRFVSRDALEQFQRECTAAAGSAPPAPPSRASSRAILDEGGI